MDWRVLTVGGGAERVLRDEITAVGVEVCLPTYVVEFFHRRRSVVVEREHLLMPNYLLVSAVPQLGRLRHGDRARVLQGLPIRESTVLDLVLRQRRGDFDVRLGSDIVPMPSLHDRVRVTLLGMTGVVRRLLGRFAEVLLDGVNRPVLVEPRGMVVV